MDAGRVVKFAAVAVSCSLLHTLLQAHYLSTCRSNWLALFSLDPGPYCALVRRGLAALQFSPLVVVGLLVPRDLLLLGAAN